MKRITYSVRDGVLAPVGFDKMIELGSPERATEVARAWAKRPEIEAARSMGRRVFIRRASLSRELFFNPEG